MSLLGVAAPASFVERNWPWLLLAAPVRRVRHMDSSHGRPGGRADGCASSRPGSDGVIDSAVGVCILQTGRRDC